MTCTLPAPFRVIETGTLVYLDTIRSGLVPAKVTKIYPGAFRAEIKITADRLAYKRGEVIEVKTTGLVPRESVYVRSGQYRIDGMRVRFVATGTDYYADKDCCPW